MLTQLDTVKARLDITPGDTSHDDFLPRAIEAVSARFDRECNRTLARTVGATQEFSAADTEIAPACYPIETVTKFELKTTEAEGWLEQTGADCVVRGGCVISLRVPLSFFPRVSWGGPQLARVTYTGGYVLPGTTPAAGQTGLPADLESAAVEQVAVWFQQRDKVGLVAFVFGFVVPFFDGGNNHALTEAVYVLNDALGERNSGMVPQRASNSSCTHLTASAELSSQRSS